MKKISLFSIPIFASGSLALWPTTVHAHCPLCVGGAGAAAGAAALLGVSYGSIGVFIGAFSLAMALWVPRLIKKQYFPHQAKALSIIIYATTVGPLLPLFEDYTSVYIDLGGEYGTLMNQTHLINLFIIGVVVGSLIVLVAPHISSRLVKLRSGKLIRFQGLLITFVLLVIAAIGMQLWSR